MYMYEGGLPTYQIQSMSFLHHHISMGHMYMDMQMHIH